MVAGNPRECRKEFDGGGMLGLGNVNQFMRGGGEGNNWIGGSSGFLNILSPRFYLFGVFVGSLFLSLTAGKTPNQRGDKLC